jgi:hypothetical protein
MPWDLVFVPEFEKWLFEQDDKLRDNIYDNFKLLEELGPLLGRPKVDTLKGSRLCNLKELRLTHMGMPIRIIFLFDEVQKGIILLGGNKANDHRWYVKSIRLAERRYTEYLSEK